MNTNIPVNYLKIINKWKKPLFIVFIGGLLLSTVFTGKKFIKPLYKSTSVVYPINIFTYSEESQTEQMLQILGSKDLHKMVVDSLDLYRHYKIDRDEPYAEEKVLKKFNNRTSIKRTQFESVKIEALDRFPKKAFEIVNCIIASYNTLSLSLVHKKADEVLAIKEQLYLSKKKEVDSLKILVDTLIRQSNLAEYNILKESMRGSYQYLTNTGKNSTPIDVLSQQSLELFFNQTLLEKELISLIELKKNYELAMSDANKQLVFADIISAPSMPQKKAFPIRWLIILISICSVMFVTFSTILIIDRKQSHQNDIRN